MLPSKVCWLLNERSSVTSRHLVTTPTSQSNQCPTQIFQPLGPFAISPIISVPGLSRPSSQNFRPRFRPHRGPEVLLAPNGSGRTRVPTSSTSNVPVSNSAALNVHFNTASGSTGNNGVKNSEKRDLLNAQRKPSSPRNMNPSGRRVPVFRARSVSPIRQVGSLFDSRRSSNICR
jgi:hypothetical protein